MKKITKLFRSVDKKEVFLFSLILAYAFAIRLYKLGEIPSVINGDEVGSILHPIQILLHKNKSIFSLTHDYSVSYLLFLTKALSISLFGIKNIVFAVRLTTAISSIAAIFPFYYILRKKVSKPVALLTTFAFVSNYWFLNFSRLSWIAVDSLFWDLILLIYIPKMIKGNKVTDFAVAGVISAIIMYNYMGGRIYVLASLIYLTYQLIFRKKTSKFFKNIILYTAVTLTLFLPEISVINKNSSLYLLRPRSLFVFNLESPYYSINPDDKIAILRHQITYSLKGFISFSNSVGAEGTENQRLIPPGLPPINNLIKILFWSGLVYCLMKHKGDPLWYLIYALNSLLLQIPSVFIPSWSRAIGVIPIIFLFSAFSLEELKNQVFKKTAYKKFSFVLIAITILIFSLNDIKKYWKWVNSEQFNLAQEPAIKVDQVTYWLPYQLKRIKNNQEPVNNYEWRAIYKSGDYKKLN